MTKRVMKTRPFQYSRITKVFIAIFAVSFAALLIAPLPGHRLTAVWILCAVAAILTIMAVIVDHAIWNEYGHNIEGVEKQYVVEEEGEI